MFKRKIERVLLINPPYTFSTYLDMDTKAGAIQNPIISLASIAGSLKDVCEVMILDFDVVEGNHLKVLIDKVEEFKPDLVGITAVTPVFPVLIEIARQVKKMDRKIIVVGGGVHVTTCTDEAVNSEDIDIVVVGEADFFIRDFIVSKDRLSLKGAYFKREGKVVFNGGADLISDLDTLPYPFWGLYDLSQYKTSRLIERNSPGGLLETSRGCPFSCNYCNKKIFGTRWRKKSIERVISEFQYMGKIGFKEIHIIDDGMSTDLKRAKSICQKLIEIKMNTPWTLLNGIRVDCGVDRELFVLLKQAGCYQVAFGIESGDDEVLKRINKGTTVKQIETAVKLADAAGLETFGFLMLGLSGETEDSMRRTIDLAKRLPLTIAKFGITVPYPGTQMFEELNASGGILHRNWKEYLIHNNKTPVFIHPNLHWDTVQAYNKKAYREFYFRPSQFFKQFIYSIKNKTLLHKLLYLFKTRWF